MFVRMALKSFGRAAVCVGAAAAAVWLFHLAVCKAPDSNIQCDVHIQPPNRCQQHNYHQQQRALAAAQELDQLALAAAEYIASLGLERDSVAALQKQQLALRQRLDHLAGVIARLSLQTLDQRQPSLDRRSSSTSSSGGMCECADGRSSSASSAGSGRQSSVRPVGSWFTRAAGMAAGSGMQAMLLELQDLMQQSWADKVDIEAVRTELLALTDRRIHEETALRDELARRVAVLEDKLQQEDELAEADQAHISSLQVNISQLSFSAA